MLTKILGKIPYEAFGSMVTGISNFIFSYMRVASRLKDKDVKQIKGGNEYA